MTIDQAHRCNAVLRTMMMEDCFADAFDAFHVVISKSIPDPLHEPTPSEIEDEVIGLHAQLMREMGE